jgi:hypothetical protein
MGNGLVVELTSESPVCRPHGRTGGSAWGRGAERGMPLLSYVERRASVTPSVLNLETLSIRPGSLLFAARPRNVTADQSEFPDIGKEILHLRGGQLLRLACSLAPL